MKKAVLPLLMLLVSLPPAAVGDTFYVIHLENGGRLLTPQYWEEDIYVKFHIGGGTMGIEKKSVRKIEQSTREIDGTQHVKQPEKGGAQPDAEPRDAVSPVPKTDALEATKKDPGIVRELSTLETKFGSRSGMSLEKLQDLKKELTVLRDKIVSNRLQHDHLAEVNRIADMRFFVNDLILIKSKNR